MSVSVEKGAFRLDNYTHLTSFQILIFFFFCFVFLKEIFLIRQVDVEMLFPFVLSLVQLFPLSKINAGFFSTPF